MIILSWLMIVVGVLLPIVLFVYKDKHYILNILFITSPIFNILLVVIGVVNNDYFMNDNNEQIGVILFILCITEVSLTVIYLIYYACLKGIAFISSENDWSRLGPKQELTLLIIMIITLLLLPNVAFAMLYDFWGILFIEDFNLGVGESIHYAFSIIYSLPMSGELEEFQGFVNVNGILIAMQMIHVLIAKIIEFIVIGFIIGKVVTLIQEKLVTRP